MMAFLVFPLTPYPSPPSLNLLPTTYPCSAIYSCSLPLLLAPSSYLKPAFPSSYPRLHLQFTVPPLPASFLLGLSCFVTFLPPFLLVGFMVCVACR